MVAHSEDERPTPLVRRSGAEQRAIGGGVIATRTIVDPAVVPAFEGRRAVELLLIAGASRPGETARGLLSRLNLECGVYPILAADGGGTTGFVGLWLGVSGGGDR